MRKVAIVVGHGGSKHRPVIAAVKKSRNYRVVTLGDIMLDVAKKRKLATTMGQMQKLPSDQNTDIRTEAVGRIAAMDGNVVLETHGGAAQHGRLFPGLSHYLTKHLRHAVGFFYIDTNGKLRKHKKLNLAILSYNANDLNIPLHVINTVGGKLDDAKKEFIDHLDSAFA